MSEYVSQLTPTLFWDVARDQIDDVKHRRFVIGRVLERGNLNDWRLTKDHYTLPVIVSEAQRMRNERLRFFSADGIKIDCVTYPYDWLKPAVDAEGLRIAAVEDIAAMKIAAATNRGTRKDFVDIYFILRQYPLDVILDWYAAKYPDGNLYLVLRSLVYFDDAEMEPMPNVLEPLDWESVKCLISDSVKALA